MNQHSFGLSLKDLPAQERPRDRLLELGPSALSISELLTLLLGVGQGVGTLSALGLGQYILKILSENGIAPLSRLREGV